MSRQGFIEAVNWVIADGTAVANSVTETVIFPNYTFFANTFSGGRRVRGKAWGKLSTTTGPPTIQFGLRWAGVAGTLLAQTALITTVASVTNVLWVVEYTIQQRAEGSSGSLLCSIEARVGAAVAPTVASATGEAAVTDGGSAGQTAPAAVTVDLTADAALALTAKWSAASASNTLTGMDYAIEVMN